MRPWVSFIQLLGFKIMKIGGLTLPEELSKLISEEKWPMTEQQAYIQHIKSPFNQKILSELVPDEETLVLSPPDVFYTVEKYLDHLDTYWLQKEVCIKQIVPKLTVVFGGFGAGSETVIALDFREQPEPTVIKLKWGEGWVNVTDTFKEFSDKLNLGDIKWKSLTSV